MFSCAVMLMNDVTFIWTFNILPTTCLKNLPEHFSENVIKAGAMFRDKFVKNGQENNVSIQNLLSDISLW